MTSTGPYRFLIGWRKTTDALFLYYLAEPLEGGASLQRECVLSPTLDLGPNPQFGIWSMNVTPTGLAAYRLEQARFQWGQISAQPGSTNLAPNGPGSATPLAVTYDDGSTIGPVLNSSYLTVSFERPDIVAFDSVASQLRALGQTGQTEVTVTYSPPGELSSSDSFFVSVGSAAPPPEDGGGSDSPGGNCEADSLHLYVSTTGSGSSCTAGTPCSLQAALDQSVGLSGACINLNPGSYGAIEVSPATYGTPEHYVTVRGNPETVSPRESSWRTMPVVQRSSAERAQLSSIRFSSYEDASGNPRPYNLRISNVDIIGGGVTIDGTAGHIAISDSNFFGVLGEFTTTSSREALYQPRSYGKIEGIEFSRNYVADRNRGTLFAGRVVGPTVTRISENHMRNFNSSVFTMSYLTTDIPIEIIGNYVRGQREVADTLKNTIRVTQVISQTHFLFAQLDGPLTHPDFLVAIDSAGARHSRKIVYDPDGIDGGAIRITEPFSFDIGVNDVLEVYDGPHGSLVSLRSAGEGALKLILRSNIFAGHGTSRLMYNYLQGSAPLIIAEENLAIAPLNSAGTFDLGNGVAAGSIFRNNTVTGIKGGKPRENLYGIAAKITSAGPITVENNIFVGSVGITAPSSSSIRRNIAYASSSLSEAGSGNNSQNTVFYNGESAGNEPLSFSGSNNFFTGDLPGETSFDDWDFRSGWDGSYQLVRPTAFIPTATSAACFGGNSVGALPCNP
ncbi:MAG: hypothetical protein KDD44_00920 [Bdellovibrionales bacterium]|nr:hypothetical protein [Bdellovibrionales bacterium]